MVSVFGKNLNLETGETIGKGRGEMSFGEVRGLKSRVGWRGKVRERERQN